MEKIKILFLLENLNSGGAERVLVNLVNNMNPERFEITVMTLFAEGVHFHALRPHVRKICKRARFFHGISYALRFFTSRALYRHYVGDDSYDVVVGYMTGIPTKIAAGAIRSKRIGWLHGNMHYVIPSQKLYWGRTHLRRTYERFDGVFGCADTVTKSFTEQIGASCRHLQTVYNVNDTDRILSQAKEQLSLPFTPDGQTPIFCTMGTLAPVKGFERLIRSCGKLVAEGHVFRLLILGDGPLRRDLEAQISALGLSDTVYLLGFHANPYPYLAASDVFVCSSFSEGLSTAVSEAIILGCAVISTDVSGAKEILGADNDYGRVIPNSEDAICTELRSFLKEREQIAYYREKANERAAFFATERLISCNETAILTVME